MTLWSYCPDSRQVYHKVSGDMIVHVSSDLPAEQAHELGRYIAEVLGMPAAEMVQAWAGVNQS